MSGLSTAAMIGAAPTNRDDQSSINSSSRPKKSEASTATMTTTPTTASTIGEQIAGFIALILFVVLVGYYMIFKQYDINYFLAILPVFWLATLLLSVVQDEVPMIASTFLFGTKRSTLQATSLEYNTQVKLIMGIVSYCIATYLLVQIQVPQEAMSVVVGGQNDNVTYISGSSIETSMYDSRDSFMNISLTWSRRFLSKTSNATSSSYNSSSSGNGNQDVVYVSNLFYLFAVLASYHMCEGAFYEFFCRIPLSTTSSGYQDVKAVANSDSYTKIERTILFPLCLVAMLFCKDHNEMTIDPTMFQINVSTLYAWMVYKIVNFIVQFHQNRSLNTHTMHLLMGSSPAGKDNYLQKQVDAAAAVSNTASSISSQQQQNKDYIWRIYGNEYDMNQYVALHPGGVETIMLAANRDDATALFQMYHPFNINKAKSVLAKYRILKNTSTTTDKNNTIKDDEGHSNDKFYDVLCHRVAQTLRSNNFDPIVDRGATYPRIMFYAAIVATFVLSAIARCHGSILATIMTALSGGVLGAHFGHDAGHFAVSRIPIINDISLWGISWVSNPFLWQHQHTFAHHSFTNDEDHDPDLHHFKGLFKLRKGEIDERDQLMQDPKVRTSFWFVVVIYAQVLFWLNLWNSSRFVVDRSFHGVLEWTDRRRWLRTVGLFTHWIVYATLLFVVPFYAYPSNSMAWLDIATYISISSFHFAVATQVGHIFEQALDHGVKAKLKSQRHMDAQHSWAADAIESTQDVAPRSLFYFYLFGGLGLQIEHHLFPALNHCHLLKIQPIVEQTCLEYGVAYKKYDNWHRAFIDTVRYLNSLE